MDHKQNSAECFSIKQCDRPDWNLNDRSLKAEFGHPNKNENVGTHSSLNHEANSGFEGRDLLVAEGIAAQQKRNALSSKTKSPKHGLGEPFGPLQLQRERIQSLEDDLKVRDTVISVILKVINEGETSVDASVGPIDSSLPIMDIQDFSSVYSPKMEKIIQLLKKNGGDSVINSFLLNQINEQGDISDLNQKISEMESQLKEKEYAIRELKLELSKKSDIIEQNKEDYSKQHNKLSIDIENLNLKIQKLSSELRKKNDEHYQTLCILHETRNEMEKNFRIQFSSISDFLKNPRGNGESSLKSWLDNTLKKYKDSHENEVACYKKQVETLQSRIKEYEMIDHEHEVELIASRKAHEAHANGYKEHVDSLLKEINSIKSEYNQQIERFQTEIEHHLEEQQALKKLHCEENRKHHENFSELVNNYTDLEKTYLKCKSELDKRTEAVEEQTYSKCKSELDKKTEAVKVINEELATKTNEIEIYLKEIKKYESIVELCKKEIHDLNQQCENDRKQVTKYKTEIDSQNHNLDFFKGKAEEYASLINNLLNIANCSVEELISIVHDHQFCEQDISKMESERKSSELELNKIKDELLQLEKSHESDVAKYKNQILKLKDELVSMSSFEQRLFMELSVHLSLRDNFKLLFNQQAELEAYFLDKDHSESFFLQNSSADSHNYILLSESGNIESQEACSDSKPKSNMSIQPSSSSIADKARLREALVFELRKEMEGRRLESLHVNNKLECVMKANNDLNEHCKSLESKYEELKNFTAEKIDELEGFNNSNRMLSNKIDRLEHENEQLKSRVEAINDELSNRKADLDSITELFDCSTDDSGRKRYSFQMKTLFRNVPSSTPNVAAASAVAKFDKSKSNSQVKVIDKIIEQITYFNDIGEENERLKKEIDEIKENDYLSQVLKSEILSFQKKTQNLGERLNLLENEKKNLFKFERMVEQLSSKNKELQKSQAALQKRIIQIEEENSVLERKCNEMKIKFTLDTVHDDDKGCEMLENLILEFSKKAEEALSLKEELSVKQESINKLENELDSLRESKNNMQLNIDVLMNDLMESEEKLALLKQNRMELGLEKRMLEQKLVSLKVKYDQLLKAESERKSGMSFQYSSFSINQNQITDPNYENCKKQLLQTKSFSSGDWCDNQNVEFTVSLLINLEHEKEFLKQKMKMFEQFLHKFLESDCDKNELDSMKNKLKEMYDQLEDSYSNFSLEANNLKTSNFDQLLSKFDCLENQYKETCSALNYEKEELQKHVHDLQDQLLEMQENMKHLKMNSEKELFDKDLKIRQAELALKALQMDNSATSYGLVCKSDSKIDIRKQYQEEMKKIHELAVSKLKTVYIDQIEENNEKAKQRVRSIEEQYQTQIEALQQEIKEKTLYLHEMKSKYLENIFNPSSNEDLETLANKKMEFKEKLKVMEKKLDPERLSYFKSLKSAFESYLEVNNACFNNSLKKEHSSNIEEIKRLLKEECEIEKTALKCKLEAQFKEEYRTKVENFEKEFKKNLNMLQWIIGYEEKETTVEARSVVLLNRLLRLVNWEYKTKLQNLSDAWNTKYSEYISNVNKKLLELETKVPKYTADSNVANLEISGENELEKALSLKENLIKTSQEFYKFLCEFHKTSLENVLTNLKDAHKEVSSRVDELRLELDKGCLVASMKDKIEDLEKEKDELKCQLKSAIGLLSKDDEIESVNVSSLLKESSIVVDYIDHTSLIDVEAKVEERLKKQYEEQFVKQRKYFENLVAELGKNYSDGIMVQHSCRLSGCSSNSGSDSNYDCNIFGSNNLTTEDRGFKTEANNSLKTMKQDEKNQLRKYEDDTLLTKNQSGFSSSHEDSSRNCTNYEEQNFKLAKKIECSESNEYINDSNTICPGGRGRQSREEYLELPRDDNMQDVIEEFGLTWKESDCNLIESGSEKNEFTQSGSESKLIHLQNEKRELERVIETLSKQNIMNDDQISVLKRQMSEYSAIISNNLCGSCGKSTKTNEVGGNLKLSRVKHECFGNSKCADHNCSKLEEKYEYLLKSLQERVDLLAQNLSLEANVKMIVDNVKTSYELDIEQMQFEYDRKVMMENIKNEELIRKFDQCLEKINSQHLFEKELLKKQMNALVEEYEERLCEQKEYAARIIDSQKSLEEKHNQEIKNTKLEFENYLVELLSDYISKSALQSSIADIEGSKELLEIELKHKIDGITKTIQTEYENRLEEERRIMLKEFCEFQRNLKPSETQQVRLPDEDTATSKSYIPPDIQALEKQISEKYEQKLVSLNEKHEAELSKLNSYYESRLQQLTEKYESDQAEMMSYGSTCGMADSNTLETLIKERDDLYKVVKNLRTAVSDIGKYLLNCEDELNKTIIQSLISSFTDGGAAVGDNNREPCDSHSDSDYFDNSLTIDKSKHVHFAPDVSTIIEGDFLLDCIEKQHDISIEIRNELEVCMKRLKSEAAAVLGLTSSKPNNALRSVESRRLASITRQLVDKSKKIKDLEMQLKEAEETVAKYEQDLADMKAELDLDKAQREKDKANSSLESIYVDREQAVDCIDSHFQKISQLQAKARNIVTQSGESGQPVHTIVIVEEMCQHVDHILEEARKERDDLQSQIESADKQLRNTRKFLDDQANEREMERDEYTRTIAELKQQLQDKERDWMSKERFASESSAFENGSLLSGKVEALEQKVQETTNLLKETEKKKDEIDRELKEADQKVLGLKDIIRDLECQDRTKTQRQTTLEQRLDELEKELESQKNDQNAMALELEAMQDGSPRDINLKQLEEHFKRQFNPNIVEQMKSQLREMARSIQRQTKYMEGLNVHISSASLSSPSEDISIREQLDLFKCQTPEGCQSPLLSLPTEEISLLQDQLSRHTKIEEIAVKRIRDQEMQLSSLQTRYEDVLAEKEVLQAKCEKQLATIASTKTTLDEVRRRAEWEQNKCDAANLEKITVLEEQLHSLHISIKNKEREATAYQQQIMRLEKIVADKEAALCNYVDSQNNQVEFLQQKLKIMEVEKGKLNVMLSKLRDGQNISLSALMEDLLAEKNADIDYLEQMVKELREGHVNTSFVESQSCSRKSSHSNSKGYRVSFAEDVEVSHVNDDERTRDAANFSNVLQDFSPHFSSTVRPVEKSDHRVITPPLLQPIPEDESKAGGDFTPNWQRPTSPKYDVVQQEELKIKLDSLEKELTWKTELIESYEKRLQEIPLLEGELKRARDDLASTISEISEDKKYYQEQLELMTEIQKQLNERELEVQELKDALAVREENLVRVTSDVKSLQLILEKSQKKIEDAKKTAITDDTRRLSEEVERLKDENIRHVQEILVLKRELDKISVAEINLLKESLSDEQKVSEKLRNEISCLLKEKDCIASELETSKQKYLSLKKELDTAMIKLLDSEKEIDKLQKYLESSTELNENLKKKIKEVDHELNVMSRKMSSEMSNRVQKDSDDLIRIKDELERLRSINHSLESDCGSLRRELNNKIEEASAMTKTSDTNSKMKELEIEVDKLRDEREMLLQSVCAIKEKFDTENSRCETLFSAAEAYKNSELLAQEKAVKEKELRSSAEKKSHFLKREYEKLKRAKKELEKKVTVLKEELDKEKKHTMELENSPVGKRRTLADLQVTPVDAIEIIPNENKISGSLDDLTDQLQNELDTSARLDDTLLSTLDMKTNAPMSILPSESLVAVLQKVIKHGFKNLTRDEMDHLYEELTLHSHRPARIAELMERITQLQNEIKKQLKIVDNLHENINIERSYLSKEKERALHLETEIDRLQKIISYQEQRLADLSSTVEQNKSQMSGLKLSLLKEKGNFQKLHVLFEGERDKIKQIQKEDAELIEDLRICLEKEKDSKVRLQLCLEQERERLQTLEAQLNAVQAAEQIVPRPNQSDHLSKCLDEWRGKCTEIGVKLEREKRHVDSLNAALDKEKHECDHLRAELYKKSAECVDLQAEVEQLKCEICKERSMNREINDKIRVIQDAEIRRQKNRAAAEEKHKRALERAKIQKRDLEVEVARLRTQLVAIKGEEPVSSWLDDVESEPLLNQIKDVNSELEKLGREKKQLTSTVKALLEENEHLELLISQSAGQQIPESELSYFFSLYIRSKSHRKALIWQKSYLMLSLQGYQDEGQRLAMKISSSLSVNRSWLPQLSVISKPSFKHAALVVIAVTRMKKIMSSRKEILGIHYKTQIPLKEHLIRRKLKLTSPRNDRLLCRTSPVREIEFTSPPRNSAGKNEGLLKPTRLADYLETFNELQARLSQALSPPDNISIGLESKILSKVSH